MLAHTLVLYFTGTGPNRRYLLLLIPLICLSVVAASPVWLDPLDQASSVITSFLTAAISEREVTEKPINTSSSHTVTGDAPHPHVPPCF